MAAVKLLTKFCPICGHDPIQPVDVPSALQLYRCGEGHHFLFEPADKEQRPSSEVKKPIE